LSSAAEGTRLESVTVPSVAKHDFVHEINLDSRPLSTVGELLTFGTTCAEDLDFRDLRGIKGQSWKT
jgi:hypothetical protein